MCKQRVRLRARRAAAGPCRCWPRGCQACKQVPNPQAIRAKCLQRVTTPPDWGGPQAPAYNAAHPCISGGTCRPKRNHAPKKPPFLPSSARTTTAAPLHSLNTGRARLAAISGSGAGATAATRRRQRLAADTLGTPIAPGRHVTGTLVVQTTAEAHRDRRAGLDWAPRRAASAVPRSCVELASCCMAIGVMRAAGMSQGPLLPCKPCGWLDQLQRSLPCGPTRDWRSDGSDARHSSCRGGSLLPPATHPQD